MHIRCDKFVASFLLLYNRTYDISNLKTDKSKQSQKNIGVKKYGKESKKIKPF